MFGSLARVKQPVSSRRLSFLDLFRGTFALLMVEGHTFRALLDSSIKSGSLFQYHEWAHGLTGPAFLFASGAAFSLATLPQWESYRSWNGKLVQRLVRFVSLLAIGYMFHLTYFSLRRTLAEGTAEQFSILLSMDILQCIAINGLLLQFLTMSLPSTRWFCRIAAAGSLGVVLAAPFVWQLADRFPLWLGMAVSGRWGSVFPLFPHLGFSLAGAAWGGLFVEARQQAAESDFLSRSRRYSIWLALGGLAAFLLPMSRLYGEFWTVGPTYFFPRLGILGVLIVLYRFAESRILPWLSVVVLIGSESLVAYSSHLFILHGSPLNPERNLLRFLGSGQNAVNTSLVLALLLAATICLCWFWNRLKRNHTWKARGFQWSLTAYLAYCFVAG